MKTKCSNNFLIKMVLAATFFIAAFSCQKDVSKQEKAQPVVDDAVSAAAHAPYNLNVLLTASEGSAYGFVKFHQNPDPAHIIDLNTWVFNLQPNHAYLLQRAVDSLKFGNCFSTLWLTLGKGLTPQAIHTDAKGNGKEALWRDVSLVTPGTEFYIHFQLIDSLTSAVALTSDCYTYTVR